MWCKGYTHYHTGFGFSQKYRVSARKLVENAYKQAEDTIKKKRDKLEELVKELLEKEVIDRKDVEAILEGKRRKVAKAQRHKGKISKP